MGRKVSTKASGKLAVLGDSRHSGRRHPFLGEQLKALRQAQARSIQERSGACGHLEKMATPHRLSQPWRINSWRFCPNASLSRTVTYKEQDRFSTGAYRK